MLIQNIELKFPCTGQQLVDFVGDVIRYKSLFEMEFEDGYKIVHDYHDITILKDCWYPILIYNEGHYNFNGYSDNENNKRLISMRLTKTWI